MTQMPPALPPLPGGGYVPPAPPQTNGLAVASLVLGIISLACSQCLTAIPGIIFGHIALGQIRRSGGTQGGRGLAIGGLVTGYISVGIVLLVLIAYAALLFLSVGGAVLSSH
ncbi:MAG: DUF4190 domain-containing protein [Planctomycetes bacterium]|nr:DUF4190 domain-containing protein [Planctomycetota bacterium]